LSKNLNDEPPTWAGGLVVLPRNTDP
jgi:hypothetical protein